MGDRGAGGDLRRVIAATSLFGTSSHQGRGRQTSTINTTRVVSPSVITSCTWLSSNSTLSLTFQT